MALTVQEILKDLLQKAPENDVMDYVLTEFAKEQLPYKLIVHVASSSNGPLSTIASTYWDSMQDVVVSHEYQWTVPTLVTCYALHT